jgi:hypothetical protein
METSNATEVPFIVLPFGSVSSHRISANKGQSKVNEARNHNLEIKSMDEIKRYQGTLSQNQANDFKAASSYLVWLVRWPYEPYLTSHA